MKEYGVKEFGMQDLDGYDIAFGQDLEDSKQKPEHAEQPWEFFGVEYWNVT